jgi:hypothetical protein
MRRIKDETHAEVCWEEMVNSDAFENGVLHGDI